MSGRTYAFLDLAALPAIGAGLLAPEPRLVWSADGRRVLWANAAGVRFLGEARLAALAERRFSEAHPATTQISRLARSLPPDAPRLERISFLAAGRLAARLCAATRIALPDGSAALLLVVEPGLPPSAPLEARARDLLEAIVAEDCLAVILDDAGAPLASAGAVEALGDAEAAADTLRAALPAGARLAKRALRIGAARRPVGICRFEAEGRPLHLAIVGPAVEIVLAEEASPGASSGAARPVPEPASAAPEPPFGGRHADGPVGAETPFAAIPPDPTAGPQPSSALPADPASFASAAETSIADATGGEEPVGADLDAPEVAPADPASADPASAEAVSTDPASARAASPQTDEAPLAAPVRFLWRMDGEGRFTELSPEFAAVFGPVAERLVGLDWSAAAVLLGVPAEPVAGLIAGRDTWSGVTIACTAPGGAVLPVDLAALPAFGRDRGFEGYRGFGVIRPPERAPRPAGRRAAPPASDAAGRAPSVALAGEPASLPPAPRLPDPPKGADRLSGTEEEAFRRIAEALGRTVPKRIGAAPATPAAAPERASSPGVAAPVPPPAPSASSTPPPPAVPEAPRDEGAPAVTPGRSAPEAVADDTPPPVPPIPVRPEPEPDRAVLDVLAAERDAALARAAELETILDTATDGILVVDRAGTIERVNRSAEALFGIDAAAVLGTPFVTLFAEESRRAAGDYLDGLAENGVASVLNDGREVIGLVPQGGLIPLFMTMGRLGATGRFAAVLRDITHWKKAEEELIAARRAAEEASMQKSDFLAKISHEIRTPLNAIIGFSEVMMEERFGPVGNARYKDYLRDINRSGGHLMSLLNDLLDISKIEAGKIDLSFEAVSLSEIVTECVALMQPQANRERIIIRTSLPSGVPSVVADPRSLRQIVLNLLSNAVKFTLAGGQVVVSTALDPSGEVTLRIRDTGIGMSEKDIETALKPFRQIATAVRPRTDGTGLGLPLTKALVEANRAAFAIDSTVGQGTMIRVTFPTTRVLAG
ncbi:ATP-binding protein [Prosthecomicrobium pneumaticum]|uniref:histidine kinase n=1 Tax=Prosthecomicrobium pneumaticum TaxID=81895 RepID=A0A7W9CV69_9HYPH|nr:ATP-binding protein [Prosthecomicrobium pneumaticum]MBB5752178.1 PAS domain S-box-containing protein [Prosthecomicrobium pneumaticum]